MPLQGYYLPGQLDRTLTDFALSSGVGLFVPKPSCGADRQRRDVPDLGTIVRQRPLASTAVGGDCYSLGYSDAARVRLCRFRAPSAAFSAEPHRSEAKQEVQDQDRSHTDYETH